MLLAGGSCWRLPWVCSQEQASPPTIGRSVGGRACMDRTEAKPATSRTGSGPAASECWGGANISSCDGQGDQRTPLPTASHAFHTNNSFTAYQI